MQFRRNKTEEPPAPVLTLPILSIIIPCFKEEENVPLMHARLTEVLMDFGKPYEIIFVDDASPDGTYDAMAKEHERDPHVKVIRLRQNSQKAGAIMAGLKLAKGTYVMTMDGDLQDEPKEIPRFLEAMNRTGLELVVGWKFHRQDPWHKKIPSRVFNFLVRKLTGITLHDADCNFRLMTKELADSVEVYGGLFRYIPSLAHHMGFRVGELKVQHNPRLHGHSKWGASRIVKGSLDLLTVSFLTGFINSPLYLFGVIGGLMGGLGIISGLLLLYEKLILRMAIAGRPLLVLTALLIIVGVQFICFGLLAELIRSERKEPTYQVRTILK